MNERYRLTEAFVSERHQEGGDLPVGTVRQTSDDECVDLTGSSTQAKVLTL